MLGNTARYILSHACDNTARYILKSKRGTHSVMLDNIVRSILDNTARYLLGHTW